MRSTGPDLSSGLPAKAESLITVVPAQPFWTENLLFAFYDPDLDIGFWLHLGTIPNDWTMWEERVLVFLPAGEGSLAMWSFHRTTPERRPAAAGPPTSGFIFACGIAIFYKYKYNINLDSSKCLLN